MLACPAEHWELTFSSLEVKHKGLPHVSFRSTIPELYAQTTFTIYFFFLVKGFRKMTDQCVLVHIKFFLCSVNITFGSLALQKASFHLQKGNVNSYHIEKELQIKAFLFILGTALKIRTDVWHYRDLAFLPRGWSRRQWDPSKNVLNPKSLKNLLNSLK